MSDADEIFPAICELHLAERLPPITFMGVWQRSLPAGWYMAVNGSKAAVKVTPPGGVKVAVPPYHAALWFNGWLAGLVHPLGGGFLAAGSAGNEKTFLAALREATRAVKEQPKEQDCQQEI